jgi:hypothetical protein
MRVHRIGNRGRSSIRRAWYRSVQTRTLACGESAAPGNSTAFVWAVWKGAPPATNAREEKLPLLFVVFLIYA